MPTVSLFCVEANCTPEDTTLGVEFLVGLVQGDCIAATASKEWNLEYETC